MAQSPATRSIISHQPVRCREAEPARRAPPYRRRHRRGRFWL